MPNEELLKMIQEAAKNNATDLDLSNKQLTELPLELFHLTKLTRLNLSQNSLTELPPEIGLLINLTALYLGGNKLTKLPTEICQLTGLTILSLSGNKLTALPPDIIRLTGLIRISLRGNQLTKLPPEICQLISLTSIDLNRNQLTSVPPEICKLTHLKELHINHNQLTKLPPEICQLTSLTRLDLGGNKLTALPPAICQLIGLTDLYLWDNQIIQLPPEIVQLSNLTTLNLWGNPITTPPPEIIENGLEAIRTYFAALEGETQLVNEVKIILVGDGAAGKTSLVKKLFNEEFDEKEDTTRGINIRHLNVEIGNRKIRGNIWDFGGQVIMHSTHQFFMSKRSLYVLVLDGRKGEQPEYWLRHIESFGGNSPILIVLNKVDADPSYKLNDPFLLEKYPSIKGFYRTSCAKDIGIGEFQAALIKELAQVEMIGIRWPRSWFKVKERLEHPDTPYISCEKYRSICEEAGISEADRQETLVDFLHDLGVAVHFKESDLRDTHVLDPKWVTAAVYKIITAKRVAEDKGILHVDSLTELLRRQDKDLYDFPVSMHQYIIDLMKQFQLCYSLDNETVLIPQLLDVVEPKCEFDYDSSLQFALLYDDFLPVSILSRFMVKVHNSIRDTQCWLTGVVLEDKKNGSTAVVKADAEKRRISIWVNGPRRKEYLHFLWYSLREINSSFEKLNVHERIPMPDNPERTADYETLLMYVELGNDIYVPDGASKSYSVKELLGLVQPKNRVELVGLGEKIDEQQEGKESWVEIFNRVVEPRITILGITFNLKELFDSLLSQKKQKRQ